MGVLRDILDLLIVREESRKRRIETKLAESELAKVERLILAATLDDVKAYDHKVRQIEDAVAEQPNAPLHQADVRARDVHPPAPSRRDLLRHRHWRVAPHIALAA